MKKINVFLMAMLVVFSMLVCCNTPGQTTQSLTGNEQDLPDELKGLKVYNVAVSESSTMKIAVLKNKVIATQETVGDDVRNVVIIHEESANKRVINVSEIVSENEDIIVCKKVRK